MFRRFPSEALTIPKSHTNVKLKPSGVDLRLAGWWNESKSVGKTQKSDINLVNKKSKDQNAHTARTTMFWVNAQTGAQCSLVNYL